MKELSIEQKAKAYDEAIEKLRGMIPNWERLSYNGKTFLHDLIYIFPELKESEDERIMKEMIEILRKEAQDFPSSVIAEKSNSWIAYLEKQGEQKPTIEMKSAEESLGVDSDTYNKIVDECIYGEQKPVDSTFEIKPKFKSGDIIKEKKTGNLFLVNSVEDFGYTLYYKNCNANGCTMSFKYEDDYELVEQKPKFRIGDTIKKESTGDIVTISEIDLKNREYRLSNTGFIPFRYEYLWELVEQKPAEEISSNPNYISPKDKALFEIATVLSQHEDKNGSPLEEIRSILIDYGINNLEANEQKPAWSEEDEKMFARFAACLTYHYHDGIITRKEYKEARDWFNILKERVQPKQEWSEENDEIIEEIINDIEYARAINYNAPKEGYEFRKNWLKSLKSQNRWKPSDEQMEAIQDAIEFLGCTKKVREDLKSLYEQLKKLREE